MSYNGSGTFVINTAGQPVVSGTVISSTAFNALTADLANGLSTAITKDGQTTPTANIPMGNNKITALANGTAATDAANLGQVQSTTAKLINSISGADTITGTLSPTLTAYAAGQMFYFVAAGDNTGAVTLNINSLGAKSVTRDGAVALAAGDIKSGEVVVVVYDGTQFQVVSQLNSSGDARFANVSIASALNVGGVATVTGGSVLNGGVVINEPGADVDTRIEGDTDANLVFVDASTDRVGVGTSTPDAKFTVSGVGAFGDGAAATPSIANTGDLNTGIWFPADDTVAVSTAGSERLRIDSSGNLGLGVTPSAWSANSGIDFTGLASVGNWQLSSNGIFLGANFYYASGAYRYKSTATATMYNAGNGAHAWYTAPSGTAGNTITFTQAMTLDASGNLLLNGTTSNGYRAQIYGSNGLALSNIANNVTANPMGVIGTFNADVNNGGLTFSTISAGTVAERARITAGGDLLVGTTSATYSTANRGLIEVNGTTDAFLGFKTGGTGRGYVAHSGSNLVLMNAENGTIEFGTNNAERARITSGGYLGIGTTNPATPLHVFNTNGTLARFTRDLATDVSLEIQADNDGAILDTIGVNNLRFFTGGTERARITSGGDLLVGTTNSSDTAGEGIKMFPTTGGVDAGKIVFVGNTASSSIYPFMVRSSSANAWQCYIDYAGNIYAQNTSITSLSDVRLKENIRELDVGIDAVMALKPRKFDWKEGKGQDKKDVRGFIAQEFEQVFPDLVSEWVDPAPDGEEAYKAVRQDLIPVLVKAIQEQQAMIKALEAKVAALEGK